MPEGDTIWRTAETLRHALKGKRITAARPDLIKRFTGATVTDVKPVGKHLLIRFDNGLAIHSHMRRQGAWHVYKPDQPWRRPAWQARALLQTQDATAVCFDAPVIDLVKDEETKVGHLGPDILAPTWSPQEVIARARRRNDTAIGELLLDQRVTAGIGNVYRCEALWWQRVNPWTPTKDLNDTDLETLYNTARQAMTSNLKTNDRNRTFPGYGPAAVHGRGGRPCRRCGTRIKVRSQGELARLTYWCPACQPGPER